MNGKTKNYCFICIDQGSSSSRAVAVAADGVVQARAAVQLLPSMTANNMCEYDAAALLDSQMEALQETLDTLPQDCEPLCIGVASQRSTIVLWDKVTGLPLCPVLSWLDGRAEKQVAENKLSHTEIHQKTGLYKTAYYSAPKIRWCIDNYTQAALALKEGRLLAGPVATYLIWHMTKGKVFAADPTLAQRTMLFNIDTQTWDEEILKSFNIPKEILPEIKCSADDYGSYKGIPITVCVGDQQAAAAGIGMLNTGDVAVNYGTGAFLLANAGPKPKHLDGILSSLSWNSKDKKADYLLEAPLNVAGSILNWLNGIGLRFELEDLPEICAQSKAPVWFLPALGGLGAPYWDFKITPIITGLNPKTTKEDIIFGAIRGLGFLMADIAFYIKKNGGLDISNIRVSGGLADCGALLQFQSDILGANILQNYEAETTAMGVAYICAAQNKIETAHWQVFNIYNLFKPQMPAGNAAQLYAKWRKFLAWAIEQKGFIN